MNLETATRLLLSVQAERRISQEARIDSYSAPMDDPAKALGALVAKLAKQATDAIDAIDAAAA